MWHIQSIGGVGSNPILYGGPSGHEAVHTVGQRFGPVGAKYTVSIPGYGYFSLEDIGDTKRGPGTWAVSVNEGQSYWFYNGEGQATINVQSDGTFIISGGASTANGKLNVSFAGMAVDLAGPNGYSLSLHDMTSPIPSVQVAAGAPSVTFSLLHPTCRGPVSCAYMTIVGPGGVVINSQSTSNPTLTVQNGPGGLVLARIKTPTPGSWTVSVTCPAGMPCYVSATVAARTDPVGSAWTAYGAASSTAKWLLAATGALVPPPAPSEGLGLAAASAGELGAAWDPWFPCALCKAEYYLLLGAFTVLVPEIPLFTYLSAKGVSEIIKAAADILSMPESTTNNVLRTISVLISPTDWPGAICKLTRQCSS